VADTRKPPPPWLINGIGHVRAGLHRLHRSTVPADLALFEIAQGAWLTQALYVATKLGIPEALADGPLRADDVARRVGSDPGATFRLMRALASSSMLKQRRDGRFALTRVGQKLRSDVPGTMAPMINSSATRTTGRIGARCCTRCVRVSRRPTSCEECRSSTIWRRIPNSRPCSTTP
jgi:hypothetical protein